MRRSVIGLLALTGCLGEAGIKRYNTDPAVTFTEPNNGDIFAAGIPLTLAANVSDGEQSSDELDYVWSISPTGEIDASGQIVTDRTVTLVLADGLGPGTWEVHLQVFDSDGAAAEDTVSFATIEYFAPIVAFTAPQDGLRVAMQLPISVEARVSDSDQGDLTSLSLAWGGIAAGEPGLPTAPDSDGAVSVLLPAPGAALEGPQTLSLTATDSTGRQGSTAITVEVVNADSDGDGYLSLEFDGDDCDDSDVTVHPGAYENCDGVDDDCDGLIDEDPPAWYLDADGDGWGDSAQTQAACDQPAGYAADAGDCDDTDAAIHPGADELCDGADQDCDGLIDDNPTDPPTAWADADGDGYGDPASALAACEVPPGYAADDTDCDDARALTNPGALEYCNGIDDDCDGAADDSVIDPLTWHRDLDSDGYGDPANTALSCPQPAGYVADDTDCDDASAAVRPGTAEYCNGYDDNCDGAADGADSVDLSIWYADADSDGYGDPGAGQAACDRPAGHVTAAADCDDADPDTRPGADEYCDGEDDDCDGAIDDNAVDMTGWYADADGDNHGAGALLDACTQPAGYAATDDDCDDADADTWPGADEYCDGEDDDCDGLTDEGDAVDAADWYSDLDSDGYGDPLSAAPSCNQPGGTVADSSDCDDGDALILPGGDEQCNGYDDDCDGLTDDADGSLNRTTTTAWYADADADGWGDANSLQQRCTAPAGYLTDASDCDDLAADVNPGETEVCNDGIDNDCDGIASECDWTGDIGVGERNVQIIGSAAGDLIGDTSTIGGDADGDGSTDIWIAARAVDTGGTNAGALYLFNDPADGRRFTSAAAATLLGEPAEQISVVIRGGADLNQDGIDDLIVGNTGSLTNVSTNNGATHVIYGPITSGDLSAASSTILTGSIYNVLGTSVAYGDLSGDGEPDLITGAPSLSNRQGVLYSRNSPLTPGTVAASASDLVLTSAVGSTRLGTACGSGDLNGDGFDDLVVGAPLHNSLGAVWIFEGPISGARTTTQADGWLYGSASSQAGTRIDIPGDINNDGTDDLIINGPNYNAGRGAIWRVDGCTTCQGTLATYAAFTLSPGSALAWGSIASGSFDNDGTTDLAVGVFSDDSQATDAGAVYVYDDIASLSGTLTDADASSRFLGEYNGDRSGTSVSAGDADGDGQDDLLITAPYEDSGGTSSGSVYLLRGPDI